MVFSLHQFLFTMYGLPAETHRRKPEDERKTHRRALATNEAHSPVEPVKAWILEKERTYGTSHVFTKEFSSLEAIALRLEAIALRVGGHRY